MTVFLVKNVEHHVTGECGFIFNADNNVPGFLALKQTETSTNTFTQVNNVSTWELIPNNNKKYKTVSPQK